MDERVAIFIDGSNLYHALKDNIGRTDLNFSEFALKLAAGRKLVRTYYYNLQQDTVRNPDGAREQGDFLNILRTMPYLEVRLGGLKMSNGIMVEKGVDIMLATDMVQYAYKDVYDTAIIVSGDSDYAYALQVVKNEGKHLEVAYMQSHASKDILELADVRHELDRAFFNGLWWGRSRAKPSGGGQPQRQQLQREQQQPRDEQAPSSGPSPRRRTRRRPSGSGGANGPSSQNNGNSNNGDGGNDNVTPLGPPSNYPGVTEPREPVSVTPYLNPELF